MLVEMTGFYSTAYKWVLLCMYVRVYVCLCLYVRVCGFICLYMRACKRIWEGFDVSVCESTDVLASNMLPSLLQMEPYFHKL